MGQLSYILFKIPLVLERDKRKRYNADDEGDENEEEEEEEKRTEMGEEKQRKEERGGKWRKMTGKKGDEK